MLHQAAGGNPPSRVSNDKSTRNLAQDGRFEVGEGNDPGRRKKPPTRF